MNFLRTFILFIIFSTIFQFSTALVLNLLIDVDDLATRLVDPSQCTYDNNLNKFVLQPTYQCSGLLGLLGLASCDGIVRPRIECQIDLYFMDNQQSINNYPCSTFSLPDAITYNTCHTQWLPPKDKLKYRIKYQFTQAGLSNVGSVQSLLNNYNNAPLSHIYSVLSTSLQSFYTTDSNRYGTCSSCTNNNSSCDKQYAGCPFDRFHVLCTPQDPPGPAQSCKMANPPIESNVCTIGGAQTRFFSTFAPTSCIIKASNAPGAPVLYIFSQFNNIPTCNDPSLTISDLYINESLPMQIYTGTWSACPATISQLYCTKQDGTSGVELCKTRAELCTNACKMLPQKTSLIVECKTTYADGSPIDTSTYIDYVNDLLPPNDCTTLFTNYIAQIDFDTPCTTSCDDQWECTYGSEHGSCNDRTMLQDIINTSHANECRNNVEIAIPSERLYLSIYDKSTSTPQLLDSTQYESLYTYFRTSNNIIKPTTVILPIYNNCTPQILCYDSLQDTSTATQDLCDLFTEPLLSTKKITTYTDGIDITHDVYNFGTDVTCSQSCDIGTYSINTLCAYFNEDDELIQTFPITSTICTDLLNLYPSSLPVPSFQSVKCLDINPQQCPTVQKCSLNDDTTLSTENCSTTTCPNPQDQCSTITNPVTITTQRHNHCFVNDFEISNNFVDVYCPDIEELPTSFSCAAPLCPTVTVQCKNTDPDDFSCPTTSLDNFCSTRCLVDIDLNDILLSCTIGSSQPILFSDWFEDQQLNPLCATVFGPIIDLIEGQKSCIGSCSQQTQCLLEEYEEGQQTPIFIPCEDVYDEISTAIQDCGENIMNTIPNNRSYLTITDTNLPSNQQPIFANSLASTTIDTFIPFLTLLNIDPEVAQLSKPISNYKSCPIGYDLCKIKGTTSASTNDICNTFRSPPTDKIIGHDSNNNNQPIYSLGNDFQCSKQCDIGIVEIEVDECVYENNQNELLTPQSATSTFCQDLFSTMDNLPPLQLPCIDITTQCHPKYYCQLNNNGDYTETNCLSKVCTNTKTVTDPITKQPVQCVDDISQPLIGSRINKCFIQSIENSANLILLADSQCRNESTPEVQFTCPSLPTCDSILHPPIDDSNKPPQLYISQEIILNGEKVYRNITLSTDINHQNNDLNGISIGSNINIDWSTMLGDNNIIKNNLNNRIIMLEIHLYPLPFPILLQSIPLSLPSPISNYTFKLDSTNPLFSRIKSWSTITNIKFTLRSSTSLFATSLTTTKLTSLSSSLLPMYSLCNINNITPLICDQSSILQLSYPTGKCDETIQQCVCFNGFIGNTCNIQMCSKQNDITQHTLECGPKENGCEIQYINNDDNNNEPKIFHIDDITSTSNIESKQLHAVCTCNDGSSGTNCQITNECSSKRQCNNNGFIWSRYEFNEISNTLDIKCDDECTCPIQGYNAVDNCSEPLLTCQNNSTLASPPIKCNCNSNTVGTTCQCKPIALITITFQSKPNNFESFRDLWHNSLINDISLDTTININCFSVMNETINNDTNEFIVNYQLYHCIDDNYDGLDLFTSAAATTTSQSFTTVFTNQYQFQNQQAIQSIQFQLINDSHHHEQLTLLSNELTTFEQFYTTADTNTTTSTASTPEFQSLFQQWKTLSTIPPEKHNETYTYTGNAADSANGISNLSDIQPIVTLTNEPTTEPNVGTAVWIIVVAVVVPCIIFITILIILCIFRQRKLCCWSETFKEKQNNDTFVDENGSTIVIARNTGTISVCDNESVVTINTTNNNNSSQSDQQGHRQQRGLAKERSIVTTHNTFTRQRNTSKTSNADNHINTQTDQMMISTPDSIELSTLQPQSNRSVTDSTALPRRFQGDSIGDVPIETLPPGWIMLQNCDDKPYYYNEENMETSWVHPSQIVKKSHAGLIGI